MVDRRRPGRGYRHLLRRGDVERFIALLPEWEELSRGLDAVVLAPGSHYRYGYHRNGVVHVCAWPVHLWDTTDVASYERDRPMLERLSVPAERRGREIVLRWTMPTARAFQLLDVFLHELGHHHDQMTPRSRREAARGEPYAEEYARRHCQAIWEAYLDAFELEALRLWAQQRRPEVGRKSSPTAVRAQTRARPIAATCAAPAEREAEGRGPGIEPSPPHD